MTSPDGLLVLDKPGGLTSRAALDRAARWFPRKTKLGHTGTLDPLATGVLVLCLGGATRLAEYVQAMRKTYVSRFRLGATSDTDDADGRLTPVPDAVPPARAALDVALAALVGVRAQVPPAYSAAKVTGRRAYDLARGGEDVRLAARDVAVYAIDVRDYAYPVLDVEVRCGKGTYIRALARDLGAALGCGAHVETLRRTRVGPFTADAAAHLDWDRDRVHARLRPAEEAVAELPRADLAEADVRRLVQGQAVAHPGAAGEVVAVFGAAGRLVGVARRAGGLLRPEKVLARG